MIGIRPPTRLLGIDLKISPRLLITFFAENHEFVQFGLFVRPLEGTDKKTLFSVISSSYELKLVKLVLGTNLATQDYALV